MAQIKVSEKSNEITAIPELLEALFIENHIITIDAMGTQRAIADKIIEKQADYILSVKGNRKELLAQLQDEFRFAASKNFDETIDIGSGRIESRKCSVISDFQFIENTDNKWNNLRQIIKIESIREFKNSNKTSETSTRYYISSLEETAKNYQKYIRSHWGIENKLHWVLDVAFGEDTSRKRAGNAAQNYSLLLKIALNLLRNEKAEKQGVQGKRLKATWNEKYLLKILNLKV